ncbi:MAG: ATP synthase subunit I [Syntrophobacterales bacterium]|nr:ATP synthase subunit I [Syntrophobacterales bacterium]
MDAQGTTPFPIKIERAGWLLLLLLIAGSLPFRSYRLTLGIALGGIISVMNFRMLYGSLKNFLVADVNRIKGAVVRRYYIRMVITAILLFLIISGNIADVIGLVIGLSVIVLDITLTAVLTIFRKNTFEEL